jgi:aminopeptidase N
VLGGAGEREIAAAYDAHPDGHALQCRAKCLAARPDPAAKESTWDSVMTDPSLSSYGLWALAEGFWQPEQADLTAPYVARFFADMPAASRLRGDLALDALVRFLYPRYAATRETLVMADGLLAREDIPLPLRRRVADLTDDLRRVVAVRRSDS